MADLRSYLIVPYGESGAGSDPGTHVPGELGREELQRESATAEDIWRRTSDWGDWGEWIVGSPLGPLMKATFRAMKHATRDPQLRTRVEEILDRARRDLEDL
jgi:hypothetical protein